MLNLKKYKPYNISLTFNPLEETYQGCHTGIVRQGLKYGMLLFIVSEVCLFFFFFLTAGEERKYVKMYEVEIKKGTRERWTVDELSPGHV